MLEQAHTEAHSPTMREEHGKYWLVIVPLSAGPQSVWEWKVYAKPGGTIAARDSEASQDEAHRAAVDWITRHGP
jgi:hypothetical protein